jgi:phospholipid transport system substrate-binding protein
LPPEPGGEPILRLVAVEWKDRIPQEREEFTRLFRNLLENAYAGKIEGYKGEKILYRKESVDLPYAEVHTVIVMLQGDEIPVDYRVLKDGARWRIYDIVIEGVSLVNNYRSQFAGILQKSSYPELVRRLKSTIQQQEKG